jgi:hypothetical protein
MNSRLLLQRDLDGKVAKNGRMVRLVTRESATQAIPGEKFHNQIPIQADHSTMVKYDEDDDGNYTIVRGKLVEVVQKFSGRVEDTHSM